MEKRREAYDCLRSSRTYTSDGLCKDGVGQSEVTRLTSRSLLSFS